ncbi:MULTISPECIES: nucleotidyltransferase domain-containing protein [unclassified Halomonas]|uniref:nucleotidyltransferase domain-containing protein n=1 Tax=unclassified Halomonas TaxID=2609666 RepID=UPI0007D9348A|nr:MULTISPECIES: nucleotidyltransferase domain-containing protein [unclassified Halomonas]MBT2788635.1 nucleotidyltransferase domain-containing protein [Halomonas sp. ISL-106]MBT2798226.1 nucleotidyltransferase domain-containing protein [Halomonas sp. ISL-104]OAL60775.1 nucleotidyltransferase [Halomonas sp. ALS9]
MIEDIIREEIMKRIKDAEAEHGVRVLYAVESGSRAWGFASPNSDYDVRFIYAHPKDWYVSVDLEEKRDVIEYEIVDEIDINGWDVRKALRLFRKSNPAFVEWLQSPIIYIERGSFASKARDLMAETYSVEKGIYHYRSMAKTNYRGYLREDTVPLKKYFYVLRPLLSIMWLEKYREPAPIEFDKLRTILSDNECITRQIEKLLERKKRSLEKELAPPVAELNKFIESELVRLEKYNEHPGSRANDITRLNTLFHEVLI